MISLNKNTPPDMRCIQLSPGYGQALIPKTWHIINPDEAGTSIYVYVFEGEWCYAYFSKINYFDIPARDHECERAEKLCCTEGFPRMVYALPVKGAEIPHVVEAFPYGAYIERPEGYDFSYNDDRYSDLTGIII